MKKFIQKNCIAFTIMEMTLVLLITSIIAAATTPILTSAVSDYSNRNYVATAGESADAPWRVSQSYDGGGIYNTKIESNSPIGMNVKFGASASNYGYPTLAIETLNSNNLFNSPQIQVTEPSSSGVSTKWYANIAMDQFDNLAIVYGNSFSAGKVGANGTNTNYIGEKSVFIGGGIQETAPDSDSALDDMYYDNSVFIGQYINTRMTENSVYMGYGITRNIHERNVIAIGQDIGTEDAYAATYQGNINIGNYSTLGRTAESIAIGNYAGVASTFKKDIIIGNYAGYNGGYYTSMIFNQGDSGNIAIGQYAGATSASRGGLSVSKGFYDVINIGGYAGFSEFSGFSDSINIGDNAGSVRSTNVSEYKMNSYYNNIDIGYYAGATYLNSKSNLMNGNVNIGFYAGYTDTGANRNVVIGSYAGNKTVATHSIIIGSGSQNVSSNSNQTGFGVNSNYAVLVGSAAGAFGTPIYGNVGIGYYAGFYSGYNPSGRNYYGNVAIGPQTCNNVHGQNKWCLGWGEKVTQDTISAANSVSVWQPNTNEPQMFIGYANNKAYNSSDWNDTAITLYANDVMVSRDGGAGPVALRWSDKRLKTNISKVFGSLDKIRSVNIYDYTLKDDDYHTPKIGVIAQEFKKIFPNDVKIEPNSKKYAVSTNSLIYVMIDAIKNLDINIQNLQKSFDNYVKDFFGLKTKVAKLEAQSKKLQAENAQIKSRLAKINAKLK